MPGLAHPRIRCGSLLRPSSVGGHSLKFPLHTLAQPADDLSPRAGLDRFYPLFDDVPCTNRAGPSLEAQLLTDEHCRCIAGAAGTDRELKKICSPFTLRPDLNLDRSIEFVQVGRRLRLARGIVSMAPGTYSGSMIPWSARALRIIALRPSR